MSAVKERVYQSSDLAGAGRTEFLAAAAKGPARLRATDGQALVMLPESQLSHLGEVRDHVVDFLAVSNAVARERDSRRITDYGRWAFVDTFDDEDIAEFIEEVRDALTRDATSPNGSRVEAVLRAWRASADVINDPLAQDIVNRDDESNMVEVTRPVEDPTG